MSQPFVAQIQIVPYNFAPRGWATCDGQLMAISQNTALFSLLGTTYGGDGRTTFALPNLQGSSPMHWDQGPGLSDYQLGQSGGSSAVTLPNSQMPLHGHSLQASASAATTGAPTGTEVLAGTPDTAIYGGAANLTPMSTGALTPAGGSAPHNNRQPYLGLLFIIALQGIFPSRP